MSTPAIDSQSAPSRLLRTTELATKRQIAGAFVRDSSPQVILGALAVLLVLRLLVGGWSVADPVTAALIVAIIGPFEWVVHLFLLHSPEDSYRFRVLKLGVGHRQHHVDPTDMQWVTLGGAGAVQYVPQISLIGAVLTLPWLWLTGSPMLGPWLTAVVMGHAALAHYEWTHLLVHARYRPKTRYYARLRRNHRLHHFRNEHYWLGVTANSGDRLMRTLPTSKTDVPLSDTARTLGTDG